MKQQLGKILAHGSRTAPFERGRWRLGSLAYRMLGTPSEGCEIATRHGFRIRLRLREFVDRTIYCTGEWEPLQTELIKRLLRPGDTFVDVGANIGYFSLLAARLLGPSGRVHAIEANRDTFDLLRANIELNQLDNVTLHLVAAGDKAGQASVVSREDGNSGADYVDYRQRPGEQQVAVERLDELFKGQSIRLLKIDVEGAEAKVIYGAETLLKAPGAPDIIFEFTPDFMSAQGDSAAALLPFLEGLGYRVLEMTNQGLKPIDARAASSGQVYLYCTKSADLPNA